MSDLEKKEEATYFSLQFTVFSFKDSPFVPPLYLFLLAPCLAIALVSRIKSIQVSRELQTFTCSGLAVLKVKYERIPYTGLRCQYCPTPTTWIKRQGDDGCQEITCPLVCQ